MKWLKVGKKEGKSLVGSSFVKGWKKNDTIVWITWSHGKSYHPYSLYSAQISLLPDKVNLRKFSENLDLATNWAHKYIIELEWGKEK